MSGTPLNDCGCCEGVGPSTPVLIENRPGLRAIAYRCGTHAQFKASLLAALTTSGHPALQDLNTRADDDFSIALLDAWAVTSDVLAFYQERIAQESYLRTATERQSLLHLGRLLGYELRPGVAASTYLAFTVENAPGGPRTAAVAVGTKVQSVPGPGEEPQLFETIEAIEARAEWNELPARQTEPQPIAASTTDVFLEGTATNVRKGDLLLFLAPDNGAARTWDACKVESVTTEFTANRTRVTLAESPAHFATATGGVSVFVFRQRAAVFGHNAPDRRSLHEDTLKKFDEQGLSVALTTPGGLFGGLILTGVRVPWPDWKFTVSTGGDFDVDLDTTYPSFVVGSWVVLRSQSLRLLGKVTAAVEAGRTDYTLTGKVTRLTVAVVASADSSGVTDFDARVRSTTVYGESQELKLVEAPITAPVAGKSLVVPGEHEEFAAGRVLGVSGKRAGSEERFTGVITLSTATAAAGITTLTYEPELPALQRETVRLNANVALATHGETVAEILGSADASVAFQSFALRQPPLTYVRSAGPTGARSTLQVWVNDLLWSEVSSFYGRGPNERVYVSRTGEDGVTRVTFGDGVNGARPPTGQDNVRAVYRRGSGVDGQVKAGQLSTLLSRPLGLKDAVNPVPATGAARREQLADARRNVPMTVLTLDRIVSLQDYEDFVRAYSGVAKALATWTWDGRHRGVFVTVAGADGAEIDLGSDFGKNLQAAVRGASVPGVPVRLQSYRKNAGLFTLSAAVKVAADRDPTSVRAAVRAALEAAFSFESREFGQPVYLSEVIAVMHATPGVVAVDVNELRRVPLPAELRPLLPTLSRVRLQSVVRRLGTPVFARDLLTATRPRGMLAGVSSASSLLHAEPLRPVAPAPPPRLSDRLIAAVPQAGTSDATIAPAELLVLAPLAPEQIGVMR